MISTTQLPVPLIVGLSVLTTTSIIYYLYRKTRQIFLPVCEVKKLFIYPIKAVKGIEVNCLEITKYGVKYGVFKDRSWVILNKSNRWIGIKNEPRLALTRTRIESDELWVDAPDMPTLKLRYIETINSDHNLISTRLYGQDIKGIVCSDEANEWFQTFLGKPGIRLIQHHPSLDYRDTNSDKRRSDDKLYPIIYQNKSGLHLINESSLRDLNSRFTKGADHVTYENFRPNVLVDYPHPWAEDKWLWMRINKVKFMQQMNCDRCPSTTVNTETGIKNMETLVALKTFRAPTGVTKKRGLGPSCGVVFAHLSDGFINVSDCIDIIVGENGVN